MIIYGPWTPFHVCVTCGGQIGDRDRMYNGGICPYCGFDSDSTICDTNTKMFRKRKIRNDNPWWMFWSLYKIEVEYK